MRTSFEPAGIAGHAYWWSSLLAHQATFALMTQRLAEMVRQADRIGESGAVPSD